MADSFKMFESKKFMWDGKEYESEEGKWLVYSRRVVTEVVVEGAPPV